MSLLHIASNSYKFVLLFYRYGFEKICVISNFDLSNKFFKYIYFTYNDYKKNQNLSLSLSLVSTYYYLFVLNEREIFTFLLLIE